MPDTEWTLLKGSAIKDSSKENWLRWEDSHTWTLNPGTGGILLSTGFWLPKPREGDSWHILWSPK